MNYWATFGAVCAIGLGALAGQARADIYHLTQTGTIASGFDTQGLFGVTGADLTGRTYSVTLTFDPGLLEFNAVNDPGFQLWSYLGATGIAEITIDGASYSYANGNPYGFSYISAKIEPPVPPGWSYAVSSTLSGAGGSIALGYFSAANFAGSLGLAAFDYTLTDADRAFIGTEPNYWEGSDFKLAFRPDTYSLTSEPGSLAGVPEPASWALMITGFGGAGAMLRRRRQGAFAA
ncbi:MAG: PEPxxWA-CTERM sorting domain-containing protein [Pseudomonadota bacterium]